MFCLLVCLVVGAFWHASVCLPSVSQPTCLPTGPGTVLVMFWQRLHTLLEEPKGYPTKMVPYPGQVRDGDAV